ncbi:MAG TPA: hypothetical protein VFB89_00205 [Gemmatimonadales bacterium]|nr:hypothetical protein [Gemmatimonadales bacterium]
MQLTFLAALALAAASLDSYLPSPAPAHQGTDLAARLTGTWHGRRTTPISIRADSFTMSWKRAPDGHMAGTVATAGEAKYPVNVVWSSDTAFIYESGPHMSALLHERVITRATVHFDGNQLNGTFEARPTKYEGKTTTGTFTALRSA